jgi:starch-binding outer membrane protein, SusD/RagB family
MTLTAKRALVITAIALTGCSTDRILQVDRPDIIDPTGLDNPAGVTALHAGVIGDLAAYMDAATGVNATVGLFTDELRFGATPPEIKQFDTRSLIEQNTLLWAVYRNVQQLRGQADRAADALKKVSASDPRIGEMNAISGLSYVLLAELFCSGIPIGTIGEEAEPLATTAVFQGGIAKLDAANTAAGSDARIKSLAAVLKARALLDLGQFDAAATAVGSVPTDFKYTTFHSATTPYQQNLYWNYMFNSDGLLVSEKEGTNGLNYATANDPRVPITGNGSPSRFDATTPRYYFALLTGFDSPSTIASGAEARLIEAEAELRKGNTATFLQKVNDLRAFQKLGPVTDPGSPAARIDLLFRERAFTLFATSHRLGDMRRLVRQYARPAESVFPTGNYHKDGLKFGTDVNFVVPTPERNNPKFTGCINRDA